MATKDWKKTGKDKWYNSKRLEFLLISNNQKYHSLVLLKGIERLLLNVGTYKEMQMASEQYRNKN